MLRNATWALSNMCRGKPRPAIEKIGVAIPYLARLLYCADSEVLSDALWAISYVADGGQDFINHVIQSQALPKVIEVLAAQNNETLHPALRIMGNICTGSNEQTTVALQHGVLSHLLPALQHKKSQFRKEAVWLVSNVTAGTPDQIQMVLDAGLMSHVLQLCEEGNFQVRKEALWAVANAVLGGAEQTHVLVQMGALKALVYGLGIQDPSLVSSIMDALESVLKKGAAWVEDEGGENWYCNIIEECGGLNKLEELQDDENEEVYAKAVRILECYFEVEGDEEEEATTGGDQAGVYDFGHC
jgi:hypothetical protein